MKIPTTYLDAFNLPPPARFYMLTRQGGATKAASEFLVGERNVDNEKLVGTDNEGVIDLYGYKAGGLRQNAAALIAFADMIEARAKELKQ